MFFWSTKDNVAADVDVRGMMHILHQSCDRGDTVDHLHDIIEDIYRNFTSIHKALDEYINREFCSDIPLSYRLMLQKMGMVVTFCRWQLNWMVREDGRMNKSSVLLLEKIESNFLLLVRGVIEAGMGVTVYNLRCAYISALAEEIEAIYRAAISRNETSLMPSYLLIKNDFLLEFFNQVYEDLQFFGDFAVRERKTMGGYLVLLKYYFELSADRFNGEEMNDFLNSSRVVAVKMAYYSFLANNTHSTHREEKFASIRHGIESDIHLGCLRAALVLPQHVSSCIPAMNNEVLTIYVNCIHNSLSELLKHKAFVDLTSPMTDQLVIIPMDISMTLLPDSRPPTTADHQKLSNIRSLFRSLMRIVSSLSISCFNDEMKGSTTSVLSDSIRKVDLMKEEIIGDMYSIVLGTHGKESLRTHRLHLLIILLESLEDLIRSKSDLTMTSKDQFDVVNMNLVLFRSFILNIEGNTSTHEGSKDEDQFDYSEKDEQIKTLADQILSCKKYIDQLDIDHQINGQEMSELLISAQVTVFEMVCRHLFRRDGEVHWWKVYFVTKDHVVSHIRVGVFTVAVLSLEASSTQPLSDVLLMGYVDCIQDNLAELVTDETGDQMKSQIKRLHQGLSSLVQLLIKYHAEKQSESKLRFQTLLGSVICSCFNDEMKGSTMSVLSDSIRKVDLMKDEIIGDMYSIVLGTHGKESLGTHRLPFLNILLKNLEDLIRSEYDLTMTSKDQIDAVDMNLVLFRYFIQNIKGNSTTHEGSKINEESDYRDKDEQIKTLADQILSCKKYIDQLDIDHQINGQEMSELLISAQVTVFEMVCRHLFRRDGEVHWWKVYFGTRDHVVSHIRVGVLRVAVLCLEASSTQPLGDELLMGFVDCIQDNMTELITDEPGDQMKTQFERLHQDLSFIILLLIKYYADQEKLSKIKLRFQDLLRNIGSAILSCFNNRVSNLVTERSVGEVDLLEKLNILQEETQGIQYTFILHAIRQESPRVHLPGFFDLLLHNWKDFMGCESDIVRIEKDQSQTIHEALVCFTSFIQNFTTNPTSDEESRKLWNDIMEAGYVAEYLLDSFAVETCPVSCASHWISEFTERIKLIEAGVMDFNCKKANDKNPELTNVVVGFKDEMTKIETKLYYSRQQLDVVSIVGMPGSGKTTLARKFYEDFSAKKHFDVRVWCIVSQEYNKKELFLTILGAKFEVTELIRFRRKSEAELSVMVHKMLKSRRYFIVLDDVWAIDAFTGLKNFFPDDNVGSRIMLTSRSRVIASQVKYHSDPIEIGHLTDEESWDLLERKIYPQGKCPSEMCQLGKKIAKKCKGLPLSVVMVAGFLAKSIEKHELWEGVAENLRSSYLDHGSQTQWMGPLELSYKFLPDPLKPLFLYLGAFPQDKEIPVDKLMWLWIADGFVQDTGLRSLEMEAEMSLTDLIDRSLIMVSKRSSDGRVKTCHIHDLLHDMCLSKAKELKFMEQIHSYYEFSESVMFQRRLSVFLKRDAPTSSELLIRYKYFPSFPVSPLRALLLFDTIDQNIQGQDHSPNFSILKLSRAIHSESTKIKVEDIIKLLHLRYISIRTDFNNIPESVSNLKNLETLIIEKVGGEIVLPCTIWEMVKLRHLHVNDLAFFSDAPENSPELVSLITLSTPAIDSGNVKNFCRKVPNVQKLGCIFNNENSYSNKEINECYDMESLHKLQSLKASYYGSLQSPGGFKLPKSLRKLSLSKFSLKWSQVSIFQNLPNLEVLKLRSAAVEDEFWDMGDDVFPELKVLKLEKLNIKTWEASEDNFPCLEKLLLEKCEQLEEIPSSLGGICSLDKIDVIWCSHSAAKSAKEIEKEQIKAGNSSLNVHIYPSQLEYDQSSPE